MVSFSRARGLIRFSLLAFGLLVLAGGIASAQTQQDFPELAPLPLAAALAAEPEPLPVDMMIEAALAFSGTPEGSMDQEREALRLEVQRFQQKASGIQDQAHLGEMALVFLHDSLLRSYSLLQARVDTALDTGVFNCVSSAVLYMILARSVGLSVGGVRTTDHAFCTVEVNGTPIDVETTNPYGFNPGTKREFKDLFGKVTGFSYVPPSDYRERTAIGEKELLALILYDRASFEIQRSNFQGAVQPAATAYSLVGSDDFKKTLAVTIADYAAWLGIRQDYQHAAALISEAETLYGDLPILDQRRAELFHNQVIGLAQSGLLDDAQTLLGNSQQDTPLDKKDWTDLSVFLVQKRAEGAARTDGFQAAAEIVAGELPRFGSQPELLKTYEAYVHNQFASLFNSRKYTEAKDFLVAALSVYPGSSALKQDLSIVQRAMRQ